MTDLEETIAACQAIGSMAEHKMNYEEDDTMNLVRDNSVGAHEVKVQCYVCGKMYWLSDMTIDIDGPAFQAYYCPSDTPAEQADDEAPATV